MDLQLLAALVLGITTIVVLVLRTRLDAFVALLVAALVTGLIAGQALTDTLGSITTGFGNTLGAIGIVIGLGVAVGKILAVPGAADALARAFVKALGRDQEDFGSSGTVTGGGDARQTEHRVGGVGVTTLDGTAALRGWTGLTTTVWLASLPLLLIASVLLDSRTLPD